MSSAGREIILVGAGGHARSVADSVIRSGEYSITGFIDHHAGASFDDIKVIGDDASLERLARRIGYAHVAIGYLGGASPRRPLCDRLQDLGYRLPVIVDPSAVVAQSASIGSGSFVGKVAVVNACAQIGDAAIINTGSIVEHDAIVGSFSHVAPGAILCGGASVGADSFVGAHATILPGISVGDGCIVGAGAVVTKSVADGVMIAGVPAHIMK